MVQSGAATPTDEMVHQVAQRVQARPLPERSNEWSAIAVHKDRIEHWLAARRPLRLSKIHQLRCSGTAAEVDQGPERAAHQQRAHRLIWAPASLPMTKLAGKAAMNWWTGGRLVVSVHTRRRSYSPRRGELSRAAGVSSSENFL